MESKWYFEQFGQRRGPMTRVQLLVCVQRGEVGPEDLVWSDAEPEPVPLSRASALVALPVAAEVLSYEGTEAQETISLRGLDLLSESRPWVRFVGVICLILATLMLILEVVFLSNGAHLRGVRLDGLAGLAAFALWPIIALFLLVFGVLVNRLASRIGRLVRAGRMLDLEIALDVQVRAWISAGCCAGLGFLFLALLLLAAVLDL